MKQNKQDLDAIIDTVTRDIRDEQVDASIVNQAATRVWARVSQTAAEHLSAETMHAEGTQTMSTTETTDHIDGCDDFRSLIPAYLAGQLSTGRKLLLEDHSNECLPCRQAIKAQRNLAAARSATYIAPHHAAAKAASKAAAGRKRWTTARVARMSIAAAVVLFAGLAGMFMYERLDLSGRTVAATVENTSGMLQVVTDADSRPLLAGEQLQKGERVRTAKDSTAMLRLADGSTVEMRERSEFSVLENMRGVTVNLDRGDVIVEAAKQHGGRLYVQTPDSLVSVKGTIFGVESGTKGSRVSVVEGEVQVTRAGKGETLRPGDQTTTNAGLEKTPVSESVAWSRNAARYAGLIADIASLRHEIDQVPRPGVRHSSRFVDLVPENTVFYAALPNLSETLAESQRIMQERISQNPALAAWWKGSERDGVDVNSQTMTRILEMGSYLGDEIVVSAELDKKGEPSGILVLGEVKDAAAFRNYLEGQIASFAKTSGDMPNVRIIDDPMTAKAADLPSAPKGEKTNRSGSELFVWIDNDTFAASPTIESLRGFAAARQTPGANQFTTSAFHQRINDVYRDGAGLLVAADIERLLAQAVAAENSDEGRRHLEGFKQLGVMNLRHFVVEQKETDGRTLSQAALTFNQADRGIATWLAAPGSMGALDFISPKANVAAAFVVKEPALLVDDLLGFIETVEPGVRTQLQDIEAQQGLSLRNDFAAPLGGEFAFAIDGPLLPTPSWKMVLEVYDQAKLQGTFERAVEKLNEFSALHGKGKLTLESSVTGDRTFYSIRTASVGPELHYTYANGYLVAAPSRALLEQSLKNREAGNTLVHSSRFRAALPQDGNTNFSAVLYHDLASLIGPLAERIKNAGGSEQELQKLGSVDANAPPTLVYAYAQGDRITVAANTEGGAFGLSPASLLGMPHAFEMQHILMNAMGDKDVQNKE